MSQNLDNSKLDRFGLETSFENGCVTYTTFQTDVAAQHTSAPVQTTWVDKPILGIGGFGLVSLQEAGGGEVRAVRKIYQ